MIREIKQAVILCGGQGLRLGDLTKETPKPLVSLLGKPVLDYIIENLKRDGITDFILAAGHLGHVIADYYAAHPIDGCSVRVVIEPNPLGTAGAIGFCRDFLDENFVVAYGDVLIDFDVKALLAFHLANHPIGTLVTWESDYIADPHTHIFEMDENNRITNVVGTRDPSKVYLNRCNAGVYVLNRCILEYTIPSRTPLDFSRDIFPQVLKNGDRLYGHLLEPTGFIKDMGTPSRLVEVEAYLRSKQ